jgi:hypothetical protein
MTGLSSFQFSLPPEGVADLVLVRSHALCLVSCSQLKHAGAYEHLVSPNGKFEAQKANLPDGTGMKLFLRRAIARRQAARCGKTTAGSTQNGR